MILAIFDALLSYFLQACVAKLVSARTRSYNNYQEAENLAFFDNFSRIKYVYVVLHVCIIKRLYKLAH